MTGMGTQSDPYLITNESELQQVTGSGYYLITKNITLSSNWTPIESFNGNLDGGYYTISGLTIADGAECKGLFGTISANATIQNVHLTNVSISVNDPNEIGGYNVGAIVGYVDGLQSAITVTIKNCSVDGSVFGSSWNIGGIIGEAAATTNSIIIIENCIMNGSVSSNGSYTGGILGYCNCNANGVINVLNCYTNCSVYSTQSDIGGIVGRINGSPIISGCCALNTSVTSLSSENIGRIYGSGTPIAYDNYALSTMTVTGNATDGINVTPEIALTKDFYENTLGYNFPPYKWVEEEGLKLIEQALDEPSHVNGGATIGQNLIAYVNNIVFGVNNNSDTMNELYDDTNDGTVFVIGCGTSETGKNGLRIVKNGSIYTNSTITTTGADFAEYYEWSEPIDEDKVGLFVSLDGEYIKLSSSTDDILGVVSAVPAYVADGQDEEWTGMYQKDVFGRKLVQDNKWLLNPEYDSSIPYIPRSARPEWSVVATLGKVVVIDDGTAEPNDYITSSNNGIATKSDVKTRFKMIKRIDNNHIKMVINHECIYN